MLTRKVVIVEDESIVAMDLKQLLIKFGYNVAAIFSSGEQAIAGMKQLQPDIILMDIHIKGALDGIETAAHLSREMRTPIIYLTAHAEEATLDRARATKPYGYLLKPFSDRELHATLQMALERRGLDLELHNSEERLRMALDAANMGSWEMDTRQRDFFCAGLAAQLLGLSGESRQFNWESVFANIHHDDQAVVADHIRKSMADNIPCEVEFRRNNVASDQRWLKIQAKTFSAEELGTSNRLVGVVQDISSRKLAEEQLRRAATVFESTQDGIVIVDKDLRVVTANQSYCRMTGYTIQDLIGRQQYSETTLPDVIATEMLASLRTHGLWRGEVPGFRKGGEQLPMLINVAAVQDEAGNFTHYVIVASDLTSIHNAQQQLYQLAHYDPVTELPNRLLGRDRLECALDAAKRHSRRVAVLFIDIDHFKFINDTFGHCIGDDLLRQIGQSLRNCLRSEDTVARLGGDEFMVILQQVQRIEEVAVTAEKIVAALQRPIELSERQLIVSASIGISLYPEDGSSGSDLIRAADTAMYAAKEQGRRRYVFYTSRMTEMASQYMELNQDLRRGLSAGELRLYYQPQVDLRSGRIIGAEALIRWQHPHKGLLGAMDIIPIAEESGLIVDIGDWVMREACRQLHSWNHAGLPPLRIAVNVSMRQIYQDRLIDTVNAALLEFAIPSNQLEIEITESTLQKEEVCLATLNKLNALGISLAVDDFGTGYSCLSSLKQLPIHRIKIDRAFIKDIPGAANDIAIARAIVAMAHQLKLTVLAEGIETLEQETLLRESGCDEAQGYLYAKPLPANEFAHLIMESTSRH